MSRAGGPSAALRRHVPLAGLVAGLLLAARPGIAACVAAALAIGPVAAQARRRSVGAAARATGGGRGGGTAATLPLAAAACLVAGAAGGHARLLALDGTALGPWIGHAAGVRAVLLEPPRPRTFGRVAAIVRVVAGPGRGERVLLRAPAPGLQGRGAGDEVRARGGWRALPRYEAAARRRGAHALLAATSAAATGRRRAGLAGALDGVRRRAERALAVGLPGRLAALARGMVLGEDQSLDDRMREQFRASGLAHLVAASGANVALLAAMVLGIGALLGAPLRARLALALAAVVAYVPVAGGGPSIQRAGAMAAAALVAALAGRPAARWHALLLAAAVTLAADPRAAGDPGWQMSFAAVLALLTVAPPLRRRLARRLPAGVADAVAVAVAASAATAPLLVAHFGRMSLVGIPANVVAAPAVAPVMWLGTLAAIAGQLAPALAAPFAALAAWPLAFVAAVAAGAASVPHAQVPVAATMAPLLIAVLAALGTAAAVPGARRLVRCRRWTLTALAAAAVVVVGVVRAGPAGHPGPPAGLVVSALDVGQGDATLVQHGGDAVLVDAGPPGGPVVGLLRAAGARRIDLLVITHAQADHEGGAAAVLAALPVGAVLDGDDGLRTAAGAAWKGEARRRGVPVLRPVQGSVLRAGPLALSVLWPPQRTPAAGARAAGHSVAAEDPNRRAIVALLRDGGFSMLLTADAESDVTAGLALGPVDVLKVAHHGSADPGLGALLGLLRPAVALIEVGRGNPYGHPAPATMRALRTVPEVLRTDRDGTVRLRVGRGSVTVERHP